ncbi:MAG: hypothetical protein L0387_32405 [Acidobacteria bacterium]|nr:hypothetical protein [Acidobacteriota bacterium]
MSTILAKGENTLQDPPATEVEATLKAQKASLEGVTDIRLRETKQASEEETTLLYDLVRPDGQQSLTTPLSVEVRFQKQDGEWKLAHTGWRGQPPENAPAQ